MHACMHACMGDFICGLNVSQNVYASVHACTLLRGAPTWCVQYSPASEKEEIPSDSVMAATCARVQGSGFRVRVSRLRARASQVQPRAPRTSNPNPSDSVMAATRGGPSRPWAVALHCSRAAVAIRSHQAKWHNRWRSTTRRRRTAPSMSTTSLRRSTRKASQPAPWGGEVDLAGSPAGAGFAQFPA
jgi:hypothetical protein